MGFRKTISALVLLAAVSALLMVPSAALGADSGKRYDGIDVSVYQEEIDFAQVKASGVDVVYIRAGYGLDKTDRYFERNAAGAKDAGLHFGFYFYMTAKNETEARQQAEFFVDLIRGKDYDCRPVMDFEKYDGLTDAQVRIIGLAFMTRLEELTGSVPMLYTDAYNAGRLWGTDYERYPLWVAEYGPEEPRVTGDAWAGWSGFQYADDGRVPGIQDAVDLDYFTDSVFLKAEENPIPETPEKAYTVVRGDTLWGISRRYGVTVSALVERNHIADPNLIYVGEVLQIPQQDTDIIYQIKTGDTLWAISRRFHVTVSDLVRENHIKDPNLIYAGESLKIPG